MASVKAGVKRLRIWETDSELPPEVFKAWCKPDLAISPVAGICTVDSDGAPRSAPFGSLRAITPKVMRLCSWHGHETYRNLKRDGRVSMALISPDVPVSVLGHARVVRPNM
jgi:flavin reductase (DIM6/NTAB) family NADH-FMN oxidoreductase RutF